MTMQVAMVGIDGIALASDTRETHPPILRENQFWSGIQYGSNASKIRISHERGIAISCALDMEVASQIADGIIRGLKDEDFENPINAIEEIARGFQTQERIKAQCIVILARPCLQMFMFQFAIINGQWGPHCRKMQSKAIAGDNVNPAIFWMERYYDESMAVGQLIPLAAYLIVCAGQINPYGIGGLEIVRCDSAGIHPLTRAENREWESKARDLERRIKDQLFQL